MSPNTYRAQCRKIRELLKSDTQKAQDLAYKLFKSFRDYRFHLGDLANGKISLATRSIVMQTLVDVGYEQDEINHVTLAERALIEARAKLHTSE